MHELISKIKKLMQGLRLIFFCAVIAIVITAFFAGKGHTDLSKANVGTDITISNPQIESQQGYLCKYTIQEANNSSTSQNVKVDISLFTNDFSNPDYNWDVTPLYTGSPRTDYIVNAPCPANIDDTGVNEITYQITTMSGKFISSKDIAISKNYTQEPIPTVSFALQRQCGQDARDYMKQYSYSQILLGSSYSPQLKACVAYSEDEYPDTGKSIYNVTNNQILGGYIYSPPVTSSYNPWADQSSTPATPIPSVLNAMQEKENSGYFISNNDPTKQYVTLDEFDKYLQWLGLSLNQ